VRQRQPVSVDVAVLVVIRRDLRAGVSQDTLHHLKPFALIAEKRRQGMPKSVPSYSLGDAGAFRRRVEVDLRPRGKRRKTEQRDGQSRAAPETSESRTIDFSLHTPFGNLVLVSKRVVSFASALSS
jgi:hypothetical protein